MAQMEVSTNNLPDGAQAYVWAMADVPGVVAANNFLVHLNPAGSGKTMQFLGLTVSTYAVGVSSTAGSMTLQRITAASGGTSVAAGNIGKFFTTQPNSKAQIFTANPAVTLLNAAGSPLIVSPPPVAAGVGGGGTTLTTPPTGTLPLLFPGEGAVFTTAAGNTNQVWNITLLWAEY